MDQRFVSDVSQIVKRLILLRKYFNITQSDMAEVAKVSPRTYQRMEYQETDVTVDALLKVASHFKINPTYFFRENEFIEKDLEKICPDKCLDENNENVNSILGKIHSAITTLKKDNHELAQMDLSTIRLNEVVFSGDVRKDMGLLESHYQLRDLAKLTDEETKYAYEFMIDHDDKILIAFAQWHYKSAGQIETIHVAKCVKSDWDQPMGYIIPVKIRHMSEPVTVSVCEILRTVKYAHQDDVMVIGLKARNITN